ACFLAPRRACIPIVTEDPFTSSPWSSLSNTLDSNCPLPAGSFSDNKPVAHCAGVDLFPSPTMSSRINVINLSFAYPASCPSFNQVVTWIGSM
ncbi:hypothetical protein ACHAXS_005659, partial [Conticribra weissflogii]